MRHLKTGIPIFGSFAILLGLYGCVDENPWGNSSNEKGSISLTLSTDSGIKTAKPMFRGGDEESSADPNDLNTYIKMPKPEEFSIKLEKSDESFSKTWTSLQGFLNYTKENFFTTGTYTMTAYYGEKGKQDFEAPYFEASTTFNVLSDQVQEISLVAELMNSMVKVNYTDGFKNYMKDYHSRIRTEGRADEIIYSKDNDSPVFVEPNNAALTVHFTTKGKDFNSAVKVGEFPPMAKTLHNITLDIVENPVGDAQLQVSFDDTLDDEDIFIDLTKELLTTPAPMISCQGFTSGETIDMLEGSSSANDLKMIVNSGDTIKSAILTVESNKFRPGWGNQIDLCKANKDEKDQIEAAGISAIGFGFKGQISNIAELDITNFGKSLPAGSHTISLQVIDQFDIPSNVVSVVLDSQPIVVDLVGTPTMVYGSRTAEVTIDYNGINPQTDISVQAVSEMGNYVNAEVLSFEEVAASRAIEKKQYKYSVKFPNNVTTARETLPIKIFHGTIEKVACELDIVVPDYNLEYDAYTDHAYVRVNVLGSTDPVVEETILENIWLYINGEQNTSDVVADYDHKVLAIGNLTPATQYRISSSITKGDSSKQNGSFTTESKLGIPNGTFEGKGDYYAMSGLQVGGQYSVSPVNYHHTSSFSVLEPADWATVNTKTAWKDSQNKNTWFIVPSSWLDDSSKRGVMRNVGYNHNGTTPGKSGGAFNTTYYCTNAPTSQQLEKAAGELFLGTYLFNGTEQRSDGIGFASRPSSLSFDYKYELKENMTDKGYALIEIIASDNSVIQHKKLDLDAVSEMKTVNVEFNYEFFGKKASKLIVHFKSSNKEQAAEIPIYIPSGSKLNEGQGLGNGKIDANSYKALATGSVLTIDNVKVHYDSGQTPANAKKRSIKKRK